MSQRSKDINSARHGLSVEEQIVVALRQINQAIDMWSRRLWHEYGLTSPQLAVLREIRGGANVSPVALADALHISQPTVTGILGRLEQAGLVRRVRSKDDRRRVIARLTKRGRQLTENAPPLLRDQFRMELDRLSRSKQTEIRDVLGRVAAMMRAPELEEIPFFFHEPRRGTNASAKSRLNGRRSRSQARG